jgi:hypothetical protein
MIKTSTELKQTPRTDARPTRPGRLALKAWRLEPRLQGVVALILQGQGRKTMGKGSEKVRTNAKKNKLREKAKRLISEGKKLTGELVKYDPRHKKAT